MPTSPSFVEHALELLSGVGPVQAYRMFGGYGLKLGGRSIGIIDDDLLFLKVDDQTRHLFEAHGARPFSFPSKSKGLVVSRGYFTLPEEALDDPDVAVRWGRMASEAALRAAGARKPPGKKRKAAPARRAAAKSTNSASSRAASSGKTKTARPAPGPAPRKVKTSPGVARTRSTRPSRKASPSPSRKASPSPSRKASPSPSRKASPSPSRKASPSPSRKASPASPSLQASPSPSRKASNR